MHSWAENQEEWQGDCLARQKGIDNVAVMAYLLDEDIAEAAVTYVEGRDRHAVSGRYQPSDGGGGGG
jgi:hypothetical protein